VSTGTVYVTQLIFDSKTKGYYVYRHRVKIDYRMDGPYDTIESAKEAFLITYMALFEIEWTKRETLSGKWTYEMRTYEPYEEVEEVEEIIEETRRDAAAGSPTLTTALSVDATGLASSSGQGASVPLTKDEGAWKRRVQVLTTRKTRVDTVASIGKTSYVYYDDIVDDSVLIERPEETEEVEVNDPFGSGKSKPLAGGKKGGSAGLSPATMAALIAASQM